MLDWLKSILQTLFRFFPFPTRAGLRVVGQPGPNAPVFVTCSFDLTVRRVIKALHGLDCYLLVAPTKGINVWCAACGGLFNSHSVASVVKTSRIADRVDHRTLVLPQLSAAGIDVARVERETGWHCRFGPVYARDIPAFVAAGLKKTDEMCLAQFPLGDRLQMAAMWAGPVSLLAVVPAVIFSPQSVFGILALIWAFALFLNVFYDPVMRYVPGPVGLVKALWVGLVGIVGVAVYGLVVANWSTGTVLGWSLSVLAVALVLGFDLEGNSPLNAGATVACWGRRWPGSLQLWAKLGFYFDPFFSLQVDPERCRGCATCIEVCPKAVFELCTLNGRRKSQVAHLESCEQCTACVKQCPERAIVAVPPVRLFGE